jgi:hypothetical protein
MVTEPAALHERDDATTVRVTGSVRDVGSSIQRIAEVGWVVRGERVLA